jgi:hypothetical protein
MFSIAKRKKLIRQLQRPLRPKELRGRAVELMNGTRYQLVENFVAALEDEGIIQLHTLEARNGKRISVYSSAPLSEIDTYELATAALPDGYFCDMSAVYHHSLTNQIPNSVYRCHKKLVPERYKGSQNISDAKIRSAFIKPPRHSNFIIQHSSREIIVIAGVRGADFGIDKVQHQHSPCPIGSRVTCLERTLIDAVVSPHYNGGIMSLCGYFHAAVKRIDAARMLGIYQDLNFSYPYAQSLGFFMERCGMTHQATEIRSAYPPRQRFYVDHGAKTTWVYDERWMIFYPKGIVDED